MRFVQTPLFPIYGEFARTERMAFVGEKADVVVDAVVDASAEEIVFGPVDATLYDSRRVRRRAYEAKFSNRALQVEDE